MLDSKELKVHNDKSMYFKILEFLKKSSSPNFVELLMPEYISEPNKHIEEYLDYYCDDRFNNYAVLIKGDWGAGKTWFIKEYEKKLKQDGFKRVVYISLNGVSGKDAIDDMIFCALHPVLSHKITKVIGRVAAGVIKTSTKIDVNDNEATLSLSIPTVDVSTVFKDGKKLILIFDDLERCQMKVSETLGYINYFVEHTESKAIILANEEKLGKSAKYKNEKEKLIGTTFEFYGDIQSALDHFIDELPRQDVKFKLQTENIKNIIIEIYRDSTLNNIRALKQSIRGFVRFFEIGYSKNDNELFEKILRIYLILSLEHKVKGAKLEFLNSTYTEREESEVGEIWKKYKFDILSNLILSSESWRKIIVDNVLDSELLKSEIKKNYFEYKAKPPIWYKLWNYYDISKDEFLNCIDETKKNLKERSFEEFGEVFHSISNLMYFKSIIKVDIDDAKKDAEHCILKVYSDKNIGNIGMYDHLDVVDAWGGYSYLSSQDKEFRDFCEFIRYRLEEYEKENLPQHADDLFNLFINDFPSFLNKIKTDGIRNDYHKTAILHLFDARKFANIYIELNRNDFRSLGVVLGKRYSLPLSMFSEKELEINWIETVIRELNDLKDKKDSIEAFRINNFHINGLEQILSEST